MPIARRNDGDDIGPVLDAWLDPPSGAMPDVTREMVEGWFTTTAVVMGMPALVTEGLSWREVRLRALAGAPVRLASREAPSEALEAEA